MNVTATTLADFMQAFIPKTWSQTLGEVYSIPTVANDDIEKLSRGIIPAKFNANYFQEAIKAFYRRDDFKEELVKADEYADEITGNWEEVPQWAIKRINFLEQVIQWDEESRCPLMHEICPKYRCEIEEGQLSCHTVKHCYPYLCDGCCGKTGEIWINSDVVQLLLTHDDIVSGMDLLEWHEKNHAEFHDASFRTLVREFKREQRTRPIDMRNMNGMCTIVRSECQNPYMDCRRCGDYTFGERS